MGGSRHTFIAGVVFLTTTCAMRPLPENVTGFTSYEIMNRLRCEARDAVYYQMNDQIQKYVFDSEKLYIDELVVDLIRYVDDRRSYAIDSGSLEQNDLRVTVVEFFREFKSDFLNKFDYTKSTVKNFEEIIIRRLKQEFANNPKKIGDVDQINVSIVMQEYVINDIVNFLFLGIAYDFEFDINVVNTAKLGAGFELPLLPGSFAIGVDIGDDRQRRNKRNFNVNEYMLKLAVLRCYDGQVSENFRYPIAGKIGLKEVIQSYSEITNDDRNPNISNFSDEITFTTTINAGADPSVDLRPLPAGFQLADATATLNLERTDVHQVVVSISPQRAGPSYTKVLLVDADGKALSGPLAGMAVRQRDVAQPQMSLGNSGPAAATVLERRELLDSSIGEDDLRDALGAIVQ